MAQIRKSDAEKKLKGTYKKSRENIDAPIPVSDEPIPDSDWPKKMIANFELFVSRLRDQGRASATFTEIITLAARTKTEYEKLARQIERHGHMIQTEQLSRGVLHKIKKKNPLLDYRELAFKGYVKALNELGLTPASIHKVKNVPKKKTLSQWRDL